MGKIDIYGGITQYDRCINNFECFNGFRCFKISDLIQIEVDDIDNEINPDNYSVDIKIFDSSNTHTRRIKNRVKIKIKWLNENGVDIPITYTVRPLVLDHICVSELLVLKQEKDIVIKKVGDNISHIPSENICGEIISYINSFSELRDDSSFQQALEICELSLAALIARIAKYWKFVSTNYGITIKYLRHLATLPNNSEIADVLLSIVSEIENRRPTQNKRT